MSDTSPLVMWFGFIATAGVIIALFGSRNASTETSYLLQECISDGDHHGHSSGSGRGSESMEGRSDLTRLQQRFLLCLWLHDARLLHQATRLKELGLDRLEDAYWLEDHHVQRVLGSDTNTWSVARHALPQDQQGLEQLKERLLERVAGDNSSSKWTWIKGVMAMSVGLGGVAMGLSLTQRLLARLPANRSPRETIQWLINTEIKQAFVQWLSGHNALANNAQVTFHWEEPCHVGSTVSFTIRFFQRGGRPYPISDADQIHINVRQGVNKVATAVQVGGGTASSGDPDQSEAHQIKASFTVRKAGQYYIYLHIGHTPIKGTPFVKNFIPGLPDGSKTNLVRPTSMAVCTVGVAHQLLLEPRDEFGNPCSWAHDASQQQRALDAFSLDCYEVGSMEPVQPLVQWLWVEVMHRLLIHVTFLDQGVYVLRVKFQKILLNKGEFSVIVLTKKEADSVEKTLQVPSLPMSYEARVLSINGDRGSKSKKVYCTVTPKQLAVKEYILGFIPKRLATFRLCPSTKFTFHTHNDQQDGAMVTIEDGSQLKVELISKEVHLLAATFAHYLIRNIGGSETFTDKQEFFYQEIRKYHQKKAHDKLLLRVERNRLLMTSMKATKYFSTSDWCKNFEITFVGEQGLDWGGLRREWFELLCVALFDRRHSGLFTSFSDDDPGASQALVHPNARIPLDYKLKHYEFAGKVVGKCLYESSLGPTYRQLVKARFTRSFLAQLIGLRVHYKYFEQDDPQLYLSKIKYIEDNDVTDMEMTFTEDEYDSSGRLIRTVELLPGGSRMIVTNENKFRYLDALAQHRLVHSVKDQVDAFVRGLNELVPDSILSIFDENELELLMCGTSEYSVAQLKANHVAVGSSAEFQRVLSWFWTAVSNFGPQELSRLLQFTTGSSQLPPGGLAELSPKLQITAAPTLGTLPTAHTCFNQLCLPDYETYEQFEKSLLLAINEGSEGFGLV